jgi:signal transduction histidine kinase
VVIAFLLAAIGAVLVWNASLRRLAERRSRELLKSRVSELKSSLKVSERTRLAAELHDSLAQDLTGVAMEIDAARKWIPPDSSRDAIRHLDFASNAIDASREELRNCIWDLRGSALDEPDINKAVGFALMPHMGEANLVCRFLVPRSKISDTLAHATIRIIRELATNAVRHGHAKTVRVAGCVDGTTLRFSVEDDGCGFDPATAPGIDQGHFGLLGISERVGALDGTFSMKSCPGKGTRAEVTLPIDGGKEDT